MALFVGSVLVSGLYLIYQKQYNTILDQSVYYGGSLGKIIAYESIVPLLQKDAIPLEVLTKLADNPELNQIKTGLGYHKSSIKYITIVDSQDVVVAHTQQSNIKKRLNRVGHPYNSLENSKDKNFISNTDDLQVIEYGLPSEGKIFNFRVPITVLTKKKPSNNSTGDQPEDMTDPSPLEEAQDTSEEKGKDVKLTFGYVHLGISQEPLANVINFLMTMMLILMACVIGAVMVIGYVFGLNLTRPIGILRRSMDDMAMGHHETRIIQKRDDEFGQLFDSFNQMAESIHQSSQTRSNHGTLGAGTITPNTPTVPGEDTEMFTEYRL